MVSRRRIGLLVGAGVGAVALAFALGGGGARPAAPAGGPTEPRAARGGEPEIPRIGLERVRASADRPPRGGRNIFGFGIDPREAAAATAAALAAAQPTPEPEPTPTPVPTPTPLPPLNVKYIGSLESKPGLKVAFFMTEKKEIVSGQVGETVMNRFRVVRIGFESVDVQQTGAEQVQRLPLRGN